jgi:hypothetical protein
VGSLHKALKAFPSAHTIRLLRANHSCNDATPRSIKRIIFGAPCRAVSPSEFGLAFDLLKALSDDRQGKLVCEWLPTATLQQAQALLDALPGLCSLTIQSTRQTFALSHLSKLKQLCLHNSDVDAASSSALRHRRHDLSSATGLSRLEVLKQHLPTTAGQLAQLQELLVQTGTQAKLSTSAAMLQQLQHLRVLHMPDVTFFNRDWPLLAGMPALEDLKASGWCIPTDCSLDPCSVTSYVSGPHDLLLVASCCCMQCPRLLAVLMQADVAALRAWPLRQAWSRLEQYKHHFAMPVRLCSCDPRPLHLPIHLPSAPAHAPGQSCTCTHACITLARSPHAG